MVKQGFAVWSLCWVFNQAASNEVSEFAAPFEDLSSLFDRELLWKWRRWVVVDGHECIVWWLMYVGWVTKSHLDCRNTDGPDVAFIVSSIFDDFWCHPARCSNYAFPPCDRIWQLGSNPKVRQLHLTISVQQDVCTFDVSVDFTIAVQEVYPLQHLS